MKRNVVKRCAFLAAALLQLGLLLAPSVVGQTPRPRRIATFGSSVAFGTGDETNKGGYTGLLRDLLAPRGWEVVNFSRPGDTTTSAATRFPSVLEAKPGYILIALALTNEGILEARTPAEKDA